MKKWICLVVLSIAYCQLNAQKLEKLWTSNSVLKVPESVLLDEKVLYVTNIDGAPAGKDGKGFISKLAQDGKIIELEWVKGLNAPKGMATSNGFLYVADIDTLVMIDKKVSILPTPYLIAGI